MKVKSIEIRPEYNRFAPGIRAFQAVTHDLTPEELEEAFIIQSKPSSYEIEFEIIAEGLEKYQIGNEIDIDYCGEKFTGLSITGAKSIEKGEYRGKTLLTASGHKVLL